MDRQVYVEATSAVQALLRANGSDILVDGKFGSYTQAAFDRAGESVKLRADALAKALGTSVAELKTQRSFDRSTLVKASASPKKDWKTIFELEVVPLVYREGAARGYAMPGLAVAQMQLESARGAKVAAAYNWGGLKPSAGQKAGAAVNTREIIDGKEVVIKANFAEFASSKEFVTAYFDRLDRLWPKAKGATSVDEWVKALNVGGKSRAYATEKPQVYASAMSRLMVA